MNKKSLCQIYMNKYMYIQIQENGQYPIENNQNAQNIENDNCIDK